MAYPTTKSNVTATTLLADAGHAAMHNAMEAVIGTTAGTSLMMNFAAGDFPVNANAGTLDNGVLGTPNIVGGTVGTAEMWGGTIGTATIGTSTVQGGTVANAIIGTSQMWGGTVGTAVIGTSTITGGTINMSVGTLNAMVMGTPAITGGTVTSATLSGIFNGWIVSTDTWVYASASTFTISGVDRTTVYTKGTRIKWMEGATQKYGVVVASSFSTNTTVTIAVNTDYVITNTALSSAAYSYHASPVGYPVWFNYATTYTGFSGNPTNDVHRFSVTGNTCTVMEREASNGTSNANNFMITPPITAVSGLTNAAWISGANFAVDGGTATGDSFALITSAAGTVIAVYRAASSTGWGTAGGKRANFQLSYEI